MTAIERDVIHYYKLAVAVSVIISVSAAFGLYSVLTLRVEGIISYLVIAFFAAVDRASKNSAAKWLAKAVSITAGIVGTFLSSAPLPVIFALVASVGDLVVTYVDTSGTFRNSLATAKGKVGILILYARLLDRHWDVQHSKLVSFLDGKPIQATKRIDQRSGAYDVTVELSIKPRTQSWQASLVQGQFVPKEQQDAGGEALSEAMQCRNEVEEVLNRAEAGSNTLRVVEKLSRASDLRKIVLKAITEPQRVSKDDADSLWTIVEELA